MTREIKLRTRGKRAFTDERIERPKLRLIPSGRIEKPIKHDDELKQLLVGLRGRQKLITRDDEGPEAA